MASNSLSEALSGLGFGAGDTGWGVAASTLGALAPKLINPRGNVGQNLGVGLGAILLTALLQYQGKKDALASSLEANTIANDLMASATTPEARVSYIKNLAEQGTDSDIVAKVSTLATALTQSDKAALVESAARRDAAKQQVLANIAQEQGLPIESADKWLQDRQRAISAGDAAATGKPAGLPEGLKTADEKVREAAALGVIDTKVKSTKTELRNSNDYKKYSEAKGALAVLAQLSERDTEAAKISATLLFNRIGNPDNQVTLNEQDRTGGADATVTRFQLWWKSLTPNERGVAGSTMSPEAMEELFEVSKLYVDSLGERSNSAITSAVSSLRSGPVPVPAEWANVGSVSPTGKLHLSSKENAQKSGEIASLHSKVQQLQQRTDIPDAVKQTAAAKAIARIQEIQEELAGFE